MHIDLVYLCTGVLPCLTADMYQPVWWEIFCLCFTSKPCWWAASFDAETGGDGARSGLSEGDQ